MADDNAMDNLKNKDEQPADSGAAPAPTAPPPAPGRSPAGGAEARPGGAGDADADGSSGTDDIGSLMSDLRGDRSGAASKFRREKERTGGAPGERRADDLDSLPDLPVEALEEDAEEVVELGEEYLEAVEEPDGEAPPALPFEEEDEEEALLDQLEDSDEAAEEAEGMRARGPRGSGRPPTIEVEAVEILDEDDASLTGGHEEDPAGEEDHEPADPLVLALEAFGAADPSLMERTLLQELDAEQDPSRTALLRHELGHLYLREMDDEGQAVKAYAMAIKLDPRLNSNIWAIRRIFISRGMWGSLIKLQDAQLRFEKNEQRKAEVLLEKGWILESTQSDKVGARDSYQQAHQINPEWLAPLLALEKLAIQDQDDEALAEVLRLEADATRDPERKTAVLLRLARLQPRLERGSLESALEVLELAALDAPDHLRLVVMVEVEQMVRSAGLPPRQLADVLRRQAEELARLEEPARMQAAGRLREAAHLLRDQGDLAGARGMLITALEALPDDPLLLRDMLDLAEQLSDRDLVDEVLHRQLEYVEDPRRRAEIWYDIALGRMRDQKDPTEALDRARELCPGYLPLLVERERRLLATGDVAGLVDLYLAEADLAVNGGDGMPLAGGPDPGWGADLLCRAGRLCSQGLQDPRRAVELLERALDLRPGYPPALDQLVTLRLRAGELKEAAGLLEELVGSCPEEDQAYYLEQLVALFGGALDDPGRQLSYLRQLHEITGQLHLLRVMVSPLRRLGRPEELEQALKELEAKEEPGELRTSWMLARAELYQHELQRPGDAADIYARVLEENPDHSFASAALEQVLRSSGRTEELAGLLRRSAAASLDAEEKLALLHRLADLSGQGAENPEGMLAAAREILELNPDDPCALRLLARAAEESGDAETLVRALEAQVESADDGLVKAALLVQLAEVRADRLDEAHAAEEDLRAAVEAAPGDRLVLGPLEALALGQLARGEHDAALVTLGRLQKEVGPREGAQLLEERAWLTELTGQDGGESALALWQEVLAHAGPEHLPALWSSLRLAARRRDLPGLATLNRELARLTTERSLKVALLLRAAAFSGMAPGEAPFPPREVYEEVLELQGDSTEAMLGLLARGGLDPLREAALMEGIAAKQEEQPRESMRLELALAYLRAGRLAESWQELRPLLDRDPEDLGALLVLDRLAAAAGDAGTRVQVLARIARLTSVSATRREAYMEAAELLEKDGRAQDAAAALLKVITEHPADAEALSRLEQIYTSTRDFKGLDRLLGHRASQAPDDGARVELLRRRAALRAEELDDRPGAARDLLRVLRIKEGDVAALRELAGLYDEEGNHARALECYQGLLEGLGSPVRERSAVLRVAELQARQAGGTGRAIETLRSYLDPVPEDDGALETLSQLYVDAGDFARAVETLERLGQLREDTAWKVANLRRIAGIYREQLEDPRHARSTLVQARALAPLDVDVVRDLVRLSREVDRPSETDSLLSQVKEDLRRKLGDNPLSVELYKKLLGVCALQEDQRTLMATLGILGVLRSASEEESALYSKAVSRRGMEALRTGGGEWQRALVHPSARGPRGELWSVISMAVPRLFEGRVEGQARSLGVGRSEKIDRRSGGQVAALIDPISGSLGLSEYDLYISPVKSDLIAGISGEEQALVLGHAVVTGLDPVRRFRLGRTLSLLRDQAFALEVLSPEELELLFAAAVHTVDPGAVRGGLPRDRVVEMSKRLYKALPRKLRKMLAPTVSKFVQDRGEQREWVLGVLHSANRAGLLICRDIVVAVEQLESSLRGGAGTTETTARALEQNPQASDLMLFSISPEFLDLR